eukprot:CAMPEP_0119381380 /NCGR_PEP_ID=MMETSP1334-20130426/63821_1 /TAXON_ID=127549 /ORGANISM="Calcidiscus leptoporus, Strain RCC1130" /LENGTH=101 /DNA_ID=CAMNT_0007401493 /DNA_START=145 /DNA_END=446 /DNA_ORIENTATION=+
MVGKIDAPALVGPELSNSALNALCSAPLGALGAPPGCAAARAQNRSAARDGMNCIAEGSCSVVPSTIIAAILCSGAQESSSASSPAFARASRASSMLSHSG